MVNENIQLGGGIGKGDSSLEGMVLVSLEGVVEIGLEDMMLRAAISSRLMRVRF